MSVDTLVRIQSRAEKRAVFGHNGGSHAPRGERRKLEGLQRNNNKPQPAAFAPGWKGSAFAQKGVK